MRAVDFADIETRVEAALRRFAPCRQYRLDVIRRDFERRRRVRARRDCAGRHAAPGLHAVLRVFISQRLEIRPRRTTRCLASRMAELDGGDGAILAQEIRDAVIHGRKTVGVDAGTTIGFARTLFNRGFFAEHDGRAAERELAEMHEVPVGRPALRRRVLAHRRHDDAVAHREPAQRKRSKQQRRRTAARRNCRVHLKLRRRRRAECARRLPSARRDRWRWKNAYTGSAHRPRPGYRPRRCQAGTARNPAR